MADGQRVYADRLHADARRRTADLVGEELRIITRDHMLSRISRLELDDAASTYRVVGPGEFHAFAEPVDIPDRIAPTPPPNTSDIPLNLRATWTDGARYTEHDAGGGELELRGAVAVRSQPSALEQNTISAGSVAITFVEIIDPEAGPKKDLARFLARGDARLESRTWRDDAPDDKPRVFYVAGQHIDFDQTTFEATIIGDGELLIRDEWSDEPVDQPRTTVTGGVGAKGATLFRWVRTLRITREVDNRFEIRMDGDVQCIHRDLDSVTTTFAGQRLTAFVEREHAESPAPADQPGMFDVGGSMRLRRLAGSGGVVIRTDQRDVTCDEFDYNTGTGLAEIIAAPGRTVSVLTEGSARPFRAERLLWDMTRDRITIHRGSGAGGS